MQYLCRLQSENVNDEKCTAHVIAVYFKHKLHTYSTRQEKHKNTIPSYKTQIL